MTHVRWSSIENFYTHRRSFRENPELLGTDPAIRYKAKVKLHGACAAIRLHPDGQVTAMSREKVLGLGKDDSYGFAAWVSEGHWGKLCHWERDLVVFGEWCGPKIQMGVAVNKIPERIFAIFAVLRMEAGREDELVVEPAEIQELLGELPVRTHILPWYYNEAKLDDAVAAWHAGVSSAGLSAARAADGKEDYPTLHEALGMTQQEYVVWATAGEYPGQVFEIDWSKSAEELGGVIETINAEVLAVEVCDPWVKANFGVEGLGEGLVLYPVSKVGLQAFAQFCFKAKGKEHRTIAHTKPVQASAPTADTVQAFVQLVCTPARLEQGVRAANGGELTYKLSGLGAFLKWLQGDILKETKAEMEAAGITNPKIALAACVNFAKEWYRQQEILQASV